MKRLIWFAIAGGSGFVTDAAVLALLLHATPLDPFSARLIAIAVAMCVTWLLNRTFTFGKSGRHVLSEGARYGGVGVTSAILNYAVYSAVLIAFPTVPPLAALVIASAAAMAFSYFGYSRFVFRR
jgi:putative flippase GtrA